MKIKYLGTGAAEGVPAFFAIVKSADMPESMAAEKSVPEPRHFWMIPYCWILARILICIFWHTGWI